jgi:ribosomal protein L11 methyltransferase
MNETVSDHEWVEVRVLVPEGWQELVAESLALGPCTSVAFGRPSLASDPVPAGFECVRTFVNVREDSPQLRRAIADALQQLANDTQAEELQAIQAEFRPLPREDYARSWMKVWKPFRVGRLAVTSPWSVSRTRVDDVCMELEPGAAFGSGRHATTRTCLRVLQERLLPGQRVLDAGSGSGILAVASVLFGAREAIGFDIDPNAEPYATKLATTNAVANRARFLTAGFECVPPLGPV